MLACPAHIWQLKATHYHRNFVHDALIQRINADQWQSRLFAKQVRVDVQFRFKMQNLERIRTVLILSARCSDRMSPKIARVPNFDHSLLFSPMSTRRDTAANSTTLAIRSLPILRIKKLQFPLRTSNTQKLTRIEWLIPNPSVGTGLESRGTEAVRPYLVGLICEN